MTLGGGSVERMNRGHFFFWNISERNRVEGHKVTDNLAFLLWDNWVEESFWTAGS